MIIKTGTPLSFSEIGRKDNQEDYIQHNTRGCFVLCDGMGGHDNGEVASRIVAETLVAELAQSQAETAADIESDFKLALQHAYDALDAADTSDSVKKMGTTMTAVVFGRWGAFVAHIGDSRIYQVRPSLADKDRNGIVYQTCDHSLVNDLLRVGELTEEEARTFPQKNIITRAMQPHQERRSKADAYVITDVEAGDYFFMCCDGVLERLSNDDLGSILATSCTDEQKLAAIKAICDEGTCDNYTCWLVPVESVLREMTDLDAEEEVTVSVEDASEPLVAQPEEAAVKPKGSKTPPNVPKPANRIIHILLPVLFVVLTLAGASWYYSKSQGLLPAEETTQKVSVEKPTKAQKDKNRKKAAKSKKAAKAPQDDKQHHSNE